MLDIQELAATTVLTLEITDSQSILVRVGSEDAVRDLSRDGSEILLPMVTRDDRPALILRVDDPPAGLAVGALLDLNVRFVVDLGLDLPLVEAVACRIALSRMPRRSVGITLPQVGRPIP
ncbi:hypothetical protein SR39_01250 [Methylobacterium radiotolerans]|nr:hypothetical protein SR39_01250 [Methylobacterium radiotolerans]